MRLAVHMEEYWLVMPELFVHTCRLVRIPQSEEPAQRFVAALRQELGPRLTRRMSQLGLSLTAALRDHTFADDPTLVYTTTFTEAQALEKYIDSFPHASPLLFQMSIHPGGIEQAMIARQQAVTEFFPLAGDGGIIAQSLRAAFLSTRPRTIWTGGEECGGWLVEADCASDQTFAWALALSDQPDGAEARISWEAEAVDSNSQAMDTGRFFAALEARESLAWNEPEIGQFHWTWL